MAVLNKVWLFILGGATSALALNNEVNIPVNPFFKPQVSFSDTELSSEVCTPFTGHWHGTCDGLEGKKDLDMKVEQIGCQTLMIDGVSFRIDGMESATTNQGAGMVTGSTVLSWDPEKTKIIGTTQAAGQVLGKLRTFKFLYKNKFTMEKEGTFLIFNTEVQSDTFINDIKKVNKGDILCRLEKVIEETKTK